MNNWIKNAAVKCISYTSISVKDCNMVKVFVTPKNYHNYRLDKKEDMKLNPHAKTCSISHENI